MRYSDITTEKIDASKITAERPSKEVYASMGTIYIGPERRKNKTMNWKKLQE